MKIAIASLLLFAFSDSTLVPPSPIYSDDLLVNGDFNKNPLNNKKGWMITSLRMGNICDLDRKWFHM
jgi:hypothetical protein